MDTRAANADTTIMMGMHTPRPVMRERAALRHVAYIYPVYDIVEHVDYLGYYGGYRKFKKQLAQRLRAEVLIVLFHSSVLFFSLNTQIIIFPSLPLSNKVPIWEHRKSP